MANINDNYTFNADTGVISRLDDNPNESDLDAAGLKAAFDAGATNVVNQINDDLIPAINARCDEIEAGETTTANNLGNISNLTTPVTTDAVSAINSVNTSLNTKTADSGWQTIPLQSGVTVGSIGGTPKCRKIGKVVYVMGSFKFNKGSNTKALAVLPEGYRPITNMYVSSNCTGYRTARTYITDDGVIGCDWIYNLNNDNAYTGDVDWYQFNVTFLVN